MPDIEIFNNMPEISFIDDLTIEGLLNQAIADYEIEYSRLTGENKILYPADPMRILINTYVLKLYQLCQYVDRAGKQDLLKYSGGEYLDHIAALRGVTRLPAQAATTTLRFTLSTVLQQKAVIPTETLVTAGDNIFFATTEYAEIPAGSLTVDIPAMCTATGTVGNSYAEGRIKVIVRPFPYAASVINTSPSMGGTEAESDASLSERTFLAPGGYSVAGPDDAYIYWVKSYSQSISDVNVYSPEPGVVDIRLLLQDGQLPDESFIAGVHDFLRENRVRPLTDRVIIAAPEIVEYDIDFVYYIRSANRNNVAGIQKNLSTALNYYISWQGKKIGRDINPSVLSRLLMEAGIKRCAIHTPEFSSISEISLAKLRFVNAIYGGIEVD